MTEIEATALTQDKLRVVDAAMLLLYDNTWRNRWPWEKFVKVWEPIVKNVDATRLGHVCEHMVRTRTEKSPPMPGEFTEMLLAAHRRYDTGPSHIPEYAPRSPANAKLVAEMFASLGLEAPTA